jgi:hypothetical protein
MSSASHSLPSMMMKNLFSGISDSDEIQRWNSHTTTSLQRRYMQV